MSSFRSTAIHAAVLTCIVVVGCAGGGSTTPAQTALNSANSSIAKADAGRVRTMSGTPELARSSDSFVDTIGVNTHLFWGAYGGNFSKVQSALAGLGIRHIRDGMVWLNWGTTYYDQLNALGDAGIHSTLSTALTQDPSKIATYIGYVPRSLEAIEAPNEPNVARGNWAPPVRAFQASMYNAVRANPANVSVSVISSALANTTSDYSVLGNLSQYLDYGNMHDYFGGNSPDASWIVGSQIAAAALVSGLKPIMATETGYCTSTANMGITAAVMGKYVPRMFFEQFNAGVARTLEYELLDDNTNPADYWNQCGLMTYNYTPKPAYTALKNLIALLRDTSAPAPRTSLTFTFLGNTGAVHHTLLQKNDGSLYLALWLNSSDFNQGTHVPITVTPQAIAVSFGSPVSGFTAYAYDDAGNLTTSNVALSQNVAQVTLTDTVQIFKIIPGTQIAHIAPVIANPAAYWSFDDGSGLVANDSITATGNATLTSNASWMNGMFGSALVLPSGAYAAAGTSLIDTSQSYSVSAWLMLGDTGTTRTAVAVQGSQVSSFTIGYIPSLGFSFRVNAGDTSWRNPMISAAAPNVVPSIGTWYPVVGVFDKANCKISLFVNGVLQSTVPGCTAFRAVGPTEFGRSLSGPGWYPAPWSGAIDDVNFYQRALTPAEVTTLSGT